MAAACSGSGWNTGGRGCCRWLGSVWRCYHWHRKQQQCRVHHIYKLSDWCKRDKQPPSRQLTIHVCRQVLLSISTVQFASGHGSVLSEIISLCRCHECGVSSSLQQHSELHWQRHNRPEQQHTAECVQVCLHQTPFPAVSRIISLVCLQSGQLPGSYCHQHHSEHSHQHHQPQPQRQFGGGWQQQDRQRQYQLPDSAGNLQLPGARCRRGHLSGGRGSGS